MNCLVFDLGAGSGRAMLVRIDGTKLELAELYRFSDIIITAESGPMWNISDLLGHIDKGLVAAANCGHKIDSIGVDSWGLDFGVIGGAGQLPERAFHYRHPRSLRGRMAFRPPEAVLFAATGCQANIDGLTIYQLNDQLRVAPELTHDARCFLLIADLVNYYLTSRAVANHTLARTSGLHDGINRRWDAGLVKAVGLSANLLPDLIQPKEIIGPLDSSLANRVGLDSGIQVISVMAHDTASAVHGLPLEGSSGFIIAGSWSLVGKEVQTLTFDDKFRQAGFGVEGGGAPHLLIKSLNGHVLFRMLKAEWEVRHGPAPDYAGLSRLALNALDRVGGVTDTQDPELFEENALINAIGQQFAVRNETPPITLDALAATIYLGLTGHVAATIAQLEELGGTAITSISIGGGGSNDQTFCQLAANQSGKTVLAGPVEASTIGNALVQFEALNALPSGITKAEIISQSFDICRYNPD